MTAPSKLTYDSSISTLDEEVTFTGSILQRYDFTADLRVEHDRMLARCDAVAAEQNKYRRAVTTCMGQIVATDMTLDAVVDKVDLAVSSATDKNRNHPLRQLLFGRWRASELKRPMLGAELEAVREWPKKLAESGQATLAELAPAVRSAVEAADAAVQALAEAQAANRAFRLTGLRRQLIDDINALRIASYGFLREYQLKHPELNLTSDFASLCFRRAQRSNGKTLEALEAELTAAELAVEALRAERDKQIAEQQLQVEARRRLERKQIEDELARAQEQEDVASKRIAELKAKLTS